MVCLAHKYHKSGGTSLDFPASTDTGTITAWYKPSQITVNHRDIISKSKSGDKIFQIEIRTGNRLRIALNNVTLISAVGVSLFTVGEPAFICWWYDGTDLKGYVNNVEVCTAARTGNIDVDADYPVYIGGDPTNIDEDHYAYGDIDDVRIYTRALSLAEIETIYYTQGKDNIVYGLQNRWLLNESSIGNYLLGNESMVDVTTSGRHGKCFGNGYAGTFSSSSSEDCPLSNITSDFALVAPSTIEAWIKPNSVSVTQRAYGNRNGANGVGLGVHNDGAIYFTTFGLKDWFSTTGVLTAGVWQHIAVVFDVYNVTGRQASFYLDGSFVSVDQDAGQGDPGTSLGTPAIGSNGGSAYEYFDGAIHSVRLWKGSARTATQIAKYMYEFPNPDDSGMVFYCRFYEGSGTSVEDVSGNTHHGTTDGGWTTYNTTGSVYSEPIALAT